jgi:hypothetical protein
MVANVPAVRQLPPAMQQVMRDGFENPQGHQACQFWCIFKGYRSGACSNGYCACSF